MFSSSLYSAFSKTTDLLWNCNVHSNTPQGRAVPPPSNGASPTPVYYTWKPQASAKIEQFQVQKKRPYEGISLLDLDEDGTTESATSGSTCEGGAHLHPRPFKKMRLRNLRSVKSAADLSTLEEVPSSMEKSDSSDNVSIKSAPGIYASPTRSTTTSSSSWETMQCLSTDPTFDSDEEDTIVIRKHDDENEEGLETISTVTLQEDISPTSTTTTTVQIKEAFPFDDDEHAEKEQEKDDQDTVLGVAPTSSSTSLDMSLGLFSRAARQPPAIISKGSHDFSNHSDKENGNGRDVSTARMLASHTQMMPIEFCPSKDDDDHGPRSVDMLNIDDEERFLLPHRRSIPRDIPEWIFVPHRRPSQGGESKTFSKINRKKQHLRVSLTKQQEFSALENRVLAPSEGHQ